MEWVRRHTVYRWAADIRLAARWSILLFRLIGLPPSTPSYHSPFSLPLTPSSLSPSLTPSFLPLFHKHHFHHFTCSSSATSGLPARRNTYQNTIEEKREGIVSERKRQRYHCGPGCCLATHTLSNRLVLCSAMLCSAVSWCSLLWLWYCVVWYFVMGCAMVWCGYCPPILPLRLWMCVLTDTKECAFVRGCETEATSIRTSSTFNSVATLFTYSFYLNTWVLLNLWLLPFSCSACQCSTSSVNIMIHF